MKIDWIILAEGIGADADGAVTAIGVNRSVFATSSLPAMTKRAVLVHVSGTHEEMAVGTAFNITVSVVSPVGRTILAQSAPLVAAAPTWLDVPTGLDLNAEFPISVSEYGDHIVRVDVDVAEHDRLSAEVMVYARKPPGA